VKPIVRETVYPFPPALVWRALMSREALSTWLMTVDGDLAPDARVSMSAPAALSWDRRVELIVRELEPERRLVLTWRGADYTTTLTWELSPSGLGTRVTLQHAGFTGWKGYVTRSILRKEWKGWLGGSLPEWLRSGSGDRVTG
jgi:uncharacterized protein YndB with AHSA1/START domain